MQELLPTSLFLANNLPQLTSLPKVTILVQLSGEGGNLPGPHFVGWHLHTFACRNRAQFRPNIIGVGSVVAIRGARAITDVGCVDAVDWSVGRQLEVIGANAVPVGIRV